MNKHSRNDLLAYLALGGCTAAAPGLETGGLDLQTTEQALGQFQYAACVPPMMCRSTTQWSVMERTCSASARAPALAHRASPRVLSGATAAVFPELQVL